MKMDIILALIKFPYRRYPRTRSMQAFHPGEVVATVQWQQRATLRSLIKIVGQTLKTSMTQKDKYCMIPLRNQICRKYTGCQGMGRRWDLEVIVKQIGSFSLGR